MRPIWQEGGRFSLTALLFLALVAFWVWFCWWVIS
jgi:hypothetical protein